MIEKRIRTNLVRLRESVNLDQNSLAKKAKVSHLAQIEAGSRAAGKKTLVKLALALGVDLVEFFRASADGQRESAWAMLHDLYVECGPRAQRLIEEVVMSIAKADAECRAEAKDRQE